MGGDHDYPPYEYLDKTGQPAGFNVDLARAIGEAMDLEVQFQLGPWPGVHRQFAEGQIDVLPIFYLAKRDLTMDFSEAFDILYHEIFIRRGSPTIRSLDAMSGLEVIVQGDAFPQIQMEDHCPTARLVPVESEAEALRLLASGKHDCALVTRTGGRQAIRRYKLTNVVTSGPPRLPAEYCFAVKEGNIWLLTQLNEGLARVRASGRFGDLNDKWLVEAPAGPPTWRDVLGYASWVLVPLGALTAAAIVWSWSLKRQVAQRTRGLETELEKRQRAEKRLLAYQKRLRALATELGLAAERERRRIAIYIHDTLAQALAAARMKLDALREATAPETPGRTEALDEVRDLVGQAAKDARSLTFDLSPPVLHELGLEAALEWLAEDMGKKHGLTVAFEDDQAPKPLAEARRIILFRAVRELLTNVTKHAHARRATVSVSRTDEHVRITVEDDGVGFDPQCVHAHEDLEGGFGLFSIRERLDYLGGRMEIRSGSGRGTCVTLTAPLDREK